jgi:hypothetical protein
MTTPNSAPERILLTVGVEALLSAMPTRRKCPNCRRKRKLVAVAVFTSDYMVAGESLPRCLECWGVRDHG